VVHTVKEMRALRKELGGPVAFVPTMGALHSGHLSLMADAASENTSVVASVFVNPTQFGPGEDFNRYPRQLDRDVALMRDAGSVSAVFAPSVEEMYPSKPAPHAFFVEPQGLRSNLESIARPGHFRGVATVVSKLFNIVQPDVAYFGQKDAIQCLLIQHMVRDLNFPVRVHISPTKREADGLAMSSRNAYLSADERRVAPTVYRSLQAAEAAFRGPQRERRVAALRSATLEVLEREPVLSVEYVSVADLATGLEVATDLVPESGALLSLAVRLGKTRLIDNVVLREREREQSKRKGEGDGAAADDVMWLWAML
jgi:pantoate--beta-alanine ligase